MPTITITTDLDGYADRTSIAPSCGNNCGDTSAKIGYAPLGKQDWNRYRAFLSFSLENLPSGVNVTRVRLKVYCRTAGGSAHLLDIHPFGGNGQELPVCQPDMCECYNNCAAGAEYVDDSDALRTTGEKWFVLGDGESAQACIDVEAAKAAVNRFSVGLHEEGDDDPFAEIDTLETSGGVPTQLEITYEVPAVVETITAKNFPMDYLPSPAKAEQLTSKVSGATIQQVSQDYPLTLIKKDKAQELISKFTTPA